MKNVHVILAIVLSALFDIQGVAAQTMESKMAGERSSRVVSNLLLRRLALAPSAVTWSTCAELSDEFQEGLREIQQIVDACKRGSKMDTAHTRDIGSACHEWAGASAAGLGWCTSIYPLCTSSEGDWYEAALLRDETMSDCYAHARQNDKDKDEAKSVLARERRFYESVHDLAAKLMPSGGLSGKVIEKNMDEIRKRHLRVLRELELLINDMEEYR